MFIFALATVFLVAILAGTVALIRFCQARFDQKDALYTVRADNCHFFGR